MISAVRSVYPYAAQIARDFYARQSRFSDPGRHRALFDILPSDPRGVASAIQGLLIYEHVTEPFYGYPLPKARRDESHIRSAAAILDMILTLDGRSLDQPRPPDRRAVGICRHFTLLALAIFRHHGVPARARVGFGDYFHPGTFEDHWICEYWSAGSGRWALLDAQFDDVFIRKLAIEHDVLDVPRARFMTAGEAWRACRLGACDPAAFGIEFVPLRGLWFIAQNLVRDLAALNGYEMLAWDAWGAQPEPYAAMSEDQLRTFDQIAAITIDPDHKFEALRARFEVDAALRVPTVVFNSLRQRDEPVFVD